MTTLIITNGDSAGDLLKLLFPKAGIVPWHDVLHEGPVPETESFDALTEIREHYLREAFPSHASDVPSKLQIRNSYLKKHKEYDRIELWFEHDLYDQMQLIQAIEFFASVGRTSDLFLIQTRTYLSNLNQRALTSERNAARRLDVKTIELAQRAWVSYQQSDPQQWGALAWADTSSLPFFRTAMFRMLEELPDTQSGLSRSERQILHHLSSGRLRPGSLFRECQSSEEAVFMGDLSFFKTLEKLSNCQAPLVSGLGPVSFAAISSDNQRERYLASELRITRAGEKSLQGQLDHIEMNGINRWWGGCLLTPKNVWRWNSKNQKLIPPSEI